ncbi:MAG TPA: hypothetical protein VKV95_04250 [Terriglobia bacterium]|nr:hypothetical protein [Terriglobia bacterium]
MKLNDVSLDDDIEQGQVVCGDAFLEPEPIGQLLGMGAGRERIGQAPPAQQETDAQQDLAPEESASGNALCPHQSASAVSRNHAFCFRGISLS